MRRVLIQISPKLLRQAKIKAAMEERSFPALVREAIAQYLKPERQERAA